MAAAMRGGSFSVLLRQARGSRGLGPAAVAGGGGHLAGLWLELAVYASGSAAYGGLGGHRACTDHDPVRLCCTHGLRRKGDCSCRRDFLESSPIMEERNCWSCGPGRVCGHSCALAAQPAFGMTISPPLPPRGSFCWLISAKPWRLGRRLRLLGGRSASDMPCKRRSGSFIGGDTAGFLTAILPEIRPDFRAGVLESLRGRTLSYPGGLRHALQLSSNAGTAADRTATAAVCWLGSLWSCWCFTHCSQAGAPRWCGPV